MEPNVDLNGEAAGSDTSLNYAENAPLTAIAPSATAADDSADLDGGGLTVAFTSGGSVDDQLGIVNQGSGPGQFQIQENDLYYQGIPVGTIAGGNDGSTPLVVTFNSNATPAVAQALIRSIGYLNFSDAPTPGDRIVAFTLSDGDGGTATPRNATITIIASDDPAFAQDDTVVTNEDAVATGSLFVNNGGGNDFDPDGPPLAVAAVNGSTDNVGQIITLASGAKLRVNSDGSYSYDPNGKFNTLTDGTSGAVNTTATETFQYTLANGNSATVTVIIAGVAGPGDRLMGDSNDNVITGTSRSDVFLLQQGGNDTAYGLGADDIFYFGAAFTRRDKVDGGDGRDVVILQGNYTLTLSSTNLVGVESLSLQSGASTRYGGNGESSYDYDITTDDANLAAGQQLIVNGQSLGEGENLTFDGSAERDGNFLVFGGHGVDTLEGGDGGDLFVFDGDRWGEGDSVDGGAGRDSLVITGDNRLVEIEFGESSLSRIESISVSNRYASDPAARPSYAFVLSDGNVAEGDTLIVNGSSLVSATQTFSVDGSDVVGGNLVLLGGPGNDTLAGGAGNDLLWGNWGADILTGGGGADIFQYRSTADSTANAADHILDFHPGADLIDLRLIDANTAVEGDQAFQYVGTEFSGNGDPSAASAGELRIYQSDGTWYAEGDVDGDGLADIRIAVTLPADTELSYGDFLP
jgi:Bacterial cadherin-like domain/RTX calcium-binding nonapeptide repeat (4 copies)